MPLCLMANWSEIIGQRNGAITKIIEIARNQCVLTAEIGGNIFSSMNARTLLRDSAGIAIDTVTETF